MVAWVELGGTNALLHDTDIASGGFDLTFDGAGAGGQFAVGTTAPLASHLVTINNTDPTTFTRALSVFSDTNLGAHNAQLSLFNSGVAGRAVRLQYVDGLDGIAMISSQRVGAGLDGNLQFITRSGGAWLEGMRLNESGLLGVGTTTPDTRINAAVAGANTEVVRFEDGTDTVGQFIVNANPNGSLVGARGSIAQDYTNGAIYVTPTMGYQLGANY